MERQAIAVSVRSLSALSIVLALLGLAGCTQTTSHTSANAASSLVLTAWRNTLAQGSAHLSFSTAGSADTSATETGVVDFAHHELQLERTTPGGDGSEIRIVGGDTYVGVSSELPPAMASALASGLPPGTVLAPPSTGSSTTMWSKQRAPSREQGLLGALGEPLLWDLPALNALVRAGAGAEQAGFADVRGTPTTEYTVTPSAGPYSEVDFYIDSGNLVRRFHVHLRTPLDPAASPSPATTHEDWDETLELYGFGVNVDVIPPASSTVTSG